MSKTFNSNIKHTNWSKCAAKFSQTSEPRRASAILTPNNLTLLFIVSSVFAFLPTPTDAIRLQVHKVDDKSTNAEEKRNGHSGSDVTSPFMSGNSVSQFLSPEDTLLFVSPEKSQIPDRLFYPDSG